MALKKHACPSGPRRPENEVTNSPRLRGVGGSGQGVPKKISIRSKEVVSF